MSTHLIITILLYISGCSDLLGYAVVPGPGKDDTASEEIQDTVDNSSETISSSSDSQFDSNEPPVSTETETETRAETDSQVVKNETDINDTTTSIDSATFENTDTPSDTHTMDSDTLDAGLETDGGGMDTDVPEQTVSLNWSVVPNAFAWISNSDNELGIQGAWNCFSDYYSDINWIWDAINESQVCISGHVSYSAPGTPFLYGAKVGFDTCGAQNTVYSLERCEWSLDLHKRIVGFEFVLTGILPSTELRAQFQEQERTDGTYVNIEEDGFHQVLFEDATLAYSPSAAPIDVSEITGFWFYIPSMAGDTNFNFCIKDVKALLSP